jgi:flagellar FliL protein
MSAATPAPAAAPAAEAPKPPPRSKKPLVLIVVAVVVLGALGGGAWFLAPRLLGAAKPEAAAATPAKEPVKATVALGSVVVNLNGEARRYVRVGVSLGVPSPKDIKEIEEHRSQILDVLIAVFSAAEVDTLMSEEGKAEIKEALLARMREGLHLEKVASVYFTEFVIQ